MPIYEYKCQTCGAISELFIQSTDAKQDVRCSCCESADVEKLLSVPSIIKEKASNLGHTCCGKTERCDTPPCSSGGKCHRG